MEAVAFAKTYNGLSAGPFLSCCVDFLFDQIPHLGATINEIELYPHCNTTDQIIQSLVRMEESFQARILTLPITRIDRRVHRIYVAYKSAWMHSDSVFGSETIYPDLSTFDLLTREMATALNLIKPKIKVTDDFDFALFQSHLSSRLHDMPTNEMHLKELQDKYLQARMLAGPDFRHS